VNIVEIAPPPAIVLMQSPAASITPGNVCAVDPWLSSKSTHLSLSTYRSWAGRARRKLATEIAIPLLRSRLQAASCCRQCFEYRPSRHPVKRHRELSQLLGNFA